MTGVRRQSSSCFRVDERQERGLVRAHRDPDIAGPGRAERSGNLPREAIVHGRKGLVDLQGEAGATSTGVLMAAVTMSVIPSLVVFLLFQRSLVRGIALSSST